MPVMPQQLRTSRKVNLVVLAISILLGLAAIEGVSRFLDKEPLSLEALHLTPKPYMMFVVPPMRNPVWRNAETGSNVPSHMVFNNLGFANDRDFAWPPDTNFVAQFGRQPDEKLVVITGGSAVLGVGATSNARTIAGQLEAVLNERHSQQRYRVLNLGMGSWIAYQQVVGLTLYGLPLAPDWIVTMDAHNDATVACSHGSGPGNPMEWPKLLQLTSGGNGYSGASSWVQWLVRNTAAARLVTGLYPDEPSEASRVYADTTDPDRRFDMKMRGVTFGDLERQLTFYLQAQQNVKELFSRANILFTTQPLLHRNPVSHWYRKAFSLSGADPAAKSKLASDLDAYMKVKATQPCGYGSDASPVGYFTPRSALALEQKAEKWALDDRHRSLMYANVETLFPSDYASRLPFFVDNVHLSDQGQRRIAEYFAGYILHTDLGVPFDPTKLAAAARARTSQHQAPTRPTRRPPASAAIDAAYSAEGAVVQPVDGLLRIVEAKGDGPHMVIWSLGSSGAVALDVWFDATVDAVRLEMGGTSADFDLAAKSVLASRDAKGAYIQDLGEGWRRLTLIPHNNTSSIGIVLLSPSDEAAATYPGADRSIIIAPPSLSQKN